MNTVNMYPITKTYNVFLACSQCGSDMIRTDDPLYFDEGHVPVFNYVYTNCAFHTVSRQSYPIQRIEYDRSSKITAREDDLE